MDPFSAWIRPAENFLLFLADRDIYSGRYFPPFGGGGTFSRNYKTGKKFEEGVGGKEKRTLKRKKAGLGSRQIF